MFRRLFLVSFLFLVIGSIVAAPSLAMGNLSRFAWAKVIEVAPSGDKTGVTDADNIEAALMANPAGGTVELTAGFFYVSRSISIEGFNGTLRGAGKNETVIEAVRRGPNPSEGFDLEDTPFGPLPHMFHFVEPVGIRIFEHVLYFLSRQFHCV